MSHTQYELSKDKIRVVFYTRVSTDQEEQKHSIASQKEYFEKFINDNEDWELVGMYCDEGITGTSAEKRLQFMKMIKDAEKGFFNLILSKNISRFARNTLDTLKYTRQLKKLNIGVIFTMDNINTLDKDGELRLSIMASLAQEEARRVSENIRWEHEKLMKKGVVFGNGNILGYDIKEGKLIVNPEQAKIVELIFDLYLEGQGTRSIQTTLQNKGIKTTTGKITWRHAVIAKLLQNEKYIGRLIQKKSITIDYLDKKRKINNGEEELIIIEKNHEPIISEEKFYKVQNEIKRRKELRNLGQRYSNKYVYSKKLKCVHCGKNLKRTVWNTLKDGTKTYAWMCTTRAEFGKKKIINGNKIGCDLIGIPEILLNEVIRLTAKEVWMKKDTIFSILEITLNSILDKNDYTNEMIEIKKTIEKISKKNNILLEMRTDGELSKSEFQIKKQEYDSIIEQQQQLLKQYDKQAQLETNRFERLEQLKKILNNDIDFNQPKLPDDYVENLLDYVIIQDKNKYKFFFSSDMEIDVIYENHSVKVQPFGINSVYSKGQKMVELEPVLTMKITNDMIRLPLGVKRAWNNIEIEVYFLIA